MIWINGIGADQVHLIVEHHPRRPIPKRKTLRYSIPGGMDRIVPLDAWELVPKSYDLALDPGPEGFDTALQAAVAWLMQPGDARGWLRLEDSYDPDVFRWASFSGGGEVEPYFARHGHVTVSFECDPRRWRKDGEVPVAFAAAGSLHNPTIYAAKPLITVHGSGAGTLTVGSRTLTLTNCNGIILDCDLEEASGVTNANSTASGAYPTLPVGDTAVSWTGGVTDIEIIPRWFVL